MDLYLELAVRTHRGTGELLQEAVDHLVSYNEWVEGKVTRSFAALERGEIVPEALSPVFKQSPHGEPCNKNNL